MQASVSCCSIGEASQDDSILSRQTPKPDDQDRMRFGFKPRRATQPAERGLDMSAIPSPARSRCGPPSCSPARSVSVASVGGGGGGACFVEIINLVEIFEAKLGDPQETKDLLNTKLVSDPRIFKERIAEVTEFNGKLKDALKKKIEKTKEAREAMARAQADIDCRMTAQAEETQSQRSEADGLRKQLQEMHEEACRLAVVSESLQRSLKESDGKNHNLREEVKQHQKRLDTMSSRASDMETMVAELGEALGQSRLETKSAQAMAEEQRGVAGDATRALHEAQRRFEAALEELRAHSALSLNEAKAEAARQLSESALQWQRKSEEAEQLQRATIEQLQAKHVAKVQELEDGARRLREERVAEAREARQTLEQERAALQAQVREREKAAAEAVAQVRAAAEAETAEKQRAAEEERRALQESVWEKERAAAEQMSKLQFAAKAEVEEKQRAFDEERVALHERLRERERAAEEQMARLRANADGEARERQRVAEDERAALQAQLRERDRAAAEQRAISQRELEMQDRVAAEERAALESKIHDGQKAATEMRASFFAQIQEKDESAARDRAALQACFQAQLQERDATIEQARVAFEAEREQLMAAVASSQVGWQTSKEHATELQARLAAEQEAAAQLAADTVERQSQLDAARAQLEGLQRTRADLAAEREAKAALAAEGALKQSQLEAARAQLEELQGTRRSLIVEQEARAKMQSDLAVERSHLEAARAQLEDMQGTRAALAAEQEARATLVADGAVQQSQLQAARAQLEEAQRAKASLATAFETLQSQLGLARAELEEARRANGALSSGEAALRSHLGALRAELGEERCKVLALEEDQRALRCHLEEAQRSSASLAAGETALRAQLGGARTELEEERRRSEALQQDAHRVRQELANFQAQLSAAQAEVGEARSVAGQESDARASLADSVRELRARIGDAQHMAEVARTELLQERSERKAEVAALQQKAEKSAGEARAATQERRMLEVEFRSYKDYHGTSNLQQLEAISDLKMTVEKLSLQYDQTQSDLAAQHSNIAAKKSQISDLERQVAEAEAARRDMHNAMQELKGNIRVICRVRPTPPGEESALQVHDVGRLSLQHGPEPCTFTFDKVFGSSCPQEEVFEEVQGLVQSALDGYKVCLFAYGQTGSGKTFTMQGTPEPRLWGIIPRSLSKVFEASRRMGAQGWTWSLEASFLEVYNETLRDLLREGSAAESTPLAIQHSDMWGTVVANASRVSVDSIEQISCLMAKAGKQRAVGSTDMNSQSSRSHSVFALYLRGVNERLGTQLHGALHLVDLAGSERLDRSGAEGDRLRETKNINRSLSCLADVFAAKAEGRAHVPFRNSKLTFLMEPCLSGHGKTLMMVNVGPESGNAHETLCSLRFAQRVGQCTTGGKPKRNAGALPAAPAGDPSSAPAAGLPQRALSSARAHNSAVISALSRSQRCVASAR